MLTFGDPAPPRSSRATSTPWWWPSPTSRADRWASGSPAAFFLEHVLHHGIEVCDYLLACDVDMEPLPGYRFANWDTGYGDLNAVVDPRTVRPLPWLAGQRPGAVRPVTMDGAPVEVSPRRILQPPARAGRRPRPRRSSAPPSSSSTSSATRSPRRRPSTGTAWHPTPPPSRTTSSCRPPARSTSSAGSATRWSRPGIPVEFSKGEAGVGQHEINVTYGGALEVADRHLVFKNGVKEIASGVRAVRHASWPSGRWTTAGSSCHIHTSLWDATSGSPLMARPMPPTRPPACPRSGEQFVAGQLFAARQLAWCFAPYVNSYRRYVPGSWAPTAVVWGEDNRTCGFRTVGHRRRPEGGVPDPRGRRQSRTWPWPPPSPAACGASSTSSSSSRPSPATPTRRPTCPGSRPPWPRPSTAWPSSEVAADAFGADVHHHLLNTARQEWAAANRVVTDWELARNFERI